MHRRSIHVQLPPGASPRTASAARARHASGGRGFTLMEIVIAVFILVIGLTMVATVFPVAAMWTRQDAERSIAALVARNAVAIIKSTYNQTDMAPAASVGTLQVLPYMATLLPLGERSYNFGGGAPYPAAAPTASDYFWTALVKPVQDNNPGQPKYTLYILVYKVVDQTQQFTTSTPLPDNSPSNAQGGRVPADTIMYYPVVAQGSLNDAAFPMGSEGIGVDSGTVFRKIAVTNSSGTTGTSETALLANNASEPVAYVPAAAGRSVSPLIYIYQTTLSF